MENTRRGRGQTKIDMAEAVKRDLKIGMYLDS
jgi:hypothetical protein